MKPFTTGAGCVSGQPITPTRAPRSLRMFQIGRASRSLAVCGFLGEKSERDERLRETVVGQQLDRRAAERAIHRPRSGCRCRSDSGRSRSRSTPARPASAAAWPGAAPRPDRKSAPMFGRRPAATSGKMKSSDAPSNISMRHVRVRSMPARRSTIGDRRAPATAAAAPGRARSSAPPPTAPSSIDRIAALTRPPRRPRCARPRIRNITPAAVTSVAPMNMRSRVFAIEHVAEAEQVEPHQRRAGRRRRSCTTTTAAAR